VLLAPRTQCTRSAGKLDTQAGDRVRGAQLRRPRRPRALDDVDETALP
jgi:hypothetical protein